MGYKNVADLSPLNPTQISPLGPARKVAHLVPFVVNRTNTTATKMAVLPADATIIGFRLFGVAVSNAATTATIALTGQGVGPGGQAFNFGTFDVKGSGGAGTYLLNTTVNTSTGTFNLERPPAVQTSGDIIIYATYAETGTASTSGGPWYFVIEYVR